MGLFLLQEIVALVFYFLSKIASYFFRSLLDWLQDKVARQTFQLMAGVILEC